jgi:D-glycero-D-manno-heptose 1,7-bisphosphate phosphatase
MERAVFLDRDGVLNRAYADADGLLHPPATPAELELLDGVRESCSQLRNAGFVLVVATNQPDVARGTRQQHVVEEINAALRREVDVDDIVVCYHDDRDACGCRKPEPGLLIDAANRWQIDLGSSFMVGDGWRDVEAGRRAGCMTVLISQQENTDKGADFCAPSLRAAVDWLVQARAEGTSARRWNFRT